MEVRVERMRKVLQEESRKEWEWYVKEIGRQEIVNVQAKKGPFLILNGISEDLQCDKYLT
jgi:hypothetical protein